jgi:hypothetical protein
MPLTSPVQTMDVHYTLDVEINPSAVRPGQRARVRFVVRNERTGAQVRRFEVIHEKIFHLFVVSRDLEYFAHVHPALGRDGVLATDIEVPAAGAYQLIADFMPAGGTPQLIQRSFVTAGYTERLGRVPSLTTDLADRTVGDMIVHVIMPDPIAGREQLVTFELRDRNLGESVTDLEPYLGAPAHLLLISADTTVAMHSHPVPELSTPGGPTVVFQILFPAAGEYRMWAQFQRHGQVQVAPFTVRVGDRF